MKSVDQIELSLGSLQPDNKRLITSPVVLDAAESLGEVRKKPKRFIELGARPDTREGVHVLPNWKEVDLLAIRPNRDYRVLFTRGASAHNVSFGLADLRTPEGLETVPVAIKSFNAKDSDPDKNGAKAMRDAVANAWALKRGFSTTDPIAVIHSTGSFIISPVRPGVQALDTEPWHQFETTQDLNIRNHFRRRLEQVGQILADLNFHGITHVDSQLRNYWITPDGKMEPFDWESAKISDDPPSAEKFLQISADTLRRLFENLQIGNKSPNEEDVTPTPILRGGAKAVWNQFTDLVLNPYISRVEDLFLESGNDELLMTVTQDAVSRALRAHLGII